MTAPLGFDEIHDLQKTNLFVFLLQWKKFAADQASTG
jgi:hypothetical protein